jgi:hypothetical protein
MEQGQVMVQALVGLHWAVAVEESDAVWDVVWDVIWRIRMLITQICPMLRIHTLPHGMVHLPMYGSEAVLGIR